MNPTHIKMNDFTETERYFIWNGKQGSDDWLRVTSYRKRASLAHVIAYGSSYRGEYLSPSHYIDVITGNIKVETNEAMSQGTIQEPIAREHYQKVTCNLVQELGTIVWKEDQTYSYSPDGFVVCKTILRAINEGYGRYVSGDELGLLEIKCVAKPYPRLWRYGEVYDSHMAQMQQGMHITNRNWCDYFVYCYTDKTYYHKRIPRDINYWNKLHSDIEKQCEVINPYLLENIVRSDP